MINWCKWKFLVWRNWWGTVHWISCRVSYIGPRRKWMSRSAYSMLVVNSKNFHQTWRKFGRFRSWRSAPWIWYRRRLPGIPKFVNTSYCFNHLLHSQMVVAEYYKMIGKTRGADFIFDDSLYGTWRYLYYVLYQILFHDTTIFISYHTGLFSI